MPGYKALPIQYSGAAAERVRFAEVLVRSGDLREAVEMLEATLGDCARESPELPGWLCGRLAALYRTVERYDDEVRLLERYRDSQRDEDASARFDARLSKARAIAERKRRPDVRALSSVRDVLAGTDQHQRSGPAVPLLEDSGFDPVTSHELRAAILQVAETGDRRRFIKALHDFCGEAKCNHFSPERMVIAIKTIWRGTTPPGTIGLVQWDALYKELLTSVLTLYFEPAR